MTAKKRPLGLFSLLMLGINGIVGVGIFLMPSEVASVAPGNVGIGIFAVTALLMLPVAFVYAILSSRFDEDGGAVVFARQAFGPGAAFAIGWLAYVATMLSATAIAIGLARSLAPDLGLEGPYAGPVCASLVALTAATASSRGLLFSARVWNFLTIGKLLPLCAFILASWLLISNLPAPVPTTEPPMSALLRATLLATFAYQGFEVIPLITGQTRNSSRVIPLALVGSLSIVALLYVSIQAACVYALPDLAHTRSPIISAAAVFGGAQFAAIVRAGATVSGLGIVFSLVTMSPRYLVALGSDGSLPGGLERLGKNGAPLRGLALTAALMIAIIAVGERANVFTLSSLVMVCQYACISAALLSLALRKRNKLSWKHALVAIPAIAVSLALASAASINEWLVALAVFALGLGLRGVARRSRSAP